ncbi:MULTISPECIES: DUF7554 family protein [unclassified Haladaptatus]|uniref:DUF7554 family protein n=1 Tax=unclassified Haladaptatus TaxID=2622732 RepID=UPI002FCE65B6
MSDALSSINIGDLLKLLLGLVVVWVALEIVLQVLDFAVEFMSSIMGLIIIALIVLWFLDTI